MNIQRCDLCPRKCGVNREKGELGFCRAGNRIEIAWHGKHFGEEPAISGPSRPKGGRGGGSGTIFFCHCNLRCVFCQNWQISQESEGYGGCKGYEGDGVAKIMVELQEMGALNINLVTPTIWSYWLKEAILRARKKGLGIPIVWNSNGYEEVKVLREFEGVVNIYLPDYKYDVEKLAMRYSSAPKYPEIAQKAILEMQRQVGDLEVGENGIAKKGLIVRHLILPNAIANTKNCLEFISSISPKVHLSLMSQYNPLYKAEKYPEIKWTLEKEEYKRILEEVRYLGFRNGWVQEFGGAVKYFTPDFGKGSPFLNVKQVGPVNRSDLLINV